MDVAPHTNQRVLSPMSDKPTYEKLLEKRIKELEENLVDAANEIPSSELRDKYMVIATKREL